MYGVADPLAAEIAELRAGLPGGTAAQAARRATLPFGADKWGRDVIAKTIKGSQTSIFVGLAAAVVATLIGTVLGAFAGYYGRWVDDSLNWFYSVFSSIPYLLLVLAVAAVLQHKGTMTIVLILGLTGWTGVFRLIRAEYLKHKGREYVQAADAIGASNARRMFKHIFPNVSHVVLVQMSILVVAFIKAEVILSFLGFGVPVDVVSWGSMLNEAQNELLLGKWWQLVAAGATMALLVTAFSLFTDALRDALDPKLKGKAGH
jgi:peptide/nickel transport system permease protein